MLQERFLEGEGESKVPNHCFPDFVRHARDDHEAAVGDRFGGCRDPRPRIPGEGARVSPGLLVLEESRGEEEEESEAGGEPPQLDGPRPGQEQEREGEEETR
jgi:hypothetical protein